MTPTEFLDALDAASEGATPGPWAHMLFRNGWIVCPRGTVQIVARLPSPVDAEFVAAHSPAVTAALRACARALPDLLALVEDMSRFVGKMALQDYQRFNEAPAEARNALAALAKAGGGS